MKENDIVIVWQMQAYTCTSTNQICIIFGKCPITTVIKCMFAFKYMDTLFQN